MIFSRVVDEIYIISELWIRSKAELWMRSSHSPPTENNQMANPSYSVSSFGQPHRITRTYIEMEFLNISLTKDSNLLLHAIHCPFKENHNLLWFSKYIQKSEKQENSSLFGNSIFLKRKMRVENWTKTRV
jgi:hypothetical protein